MTIILYIFIKMAKGYQKRLKLYRLWQIWHVEMSPGGNHWPTNSLEYPCCMKPNIYPLVIWRSYWKWPLIVDFPINSMVIFNSYVSLPVGIWDGWKTLITGWRFGGFKDFSKAVLVWWCLMVFRGFCCWWLSSGWWFGTGILFFQILGIIILTDFHIFQTGWNHQPD